MSNESTSSASDDQKNDLLNQYQKLHDGLSDMVESGRLTQADIPDDYHWLVEKMLVPLANHPAQALGEKP